MTASSWVAVDAYVANLLIPDDAALRAALEASIAAGLPAISVSPLQGKLLQLLARMQGARNVLEIGTLGGYSTIWLARALPPGGRLITLEVDARHAEIARANIALAGLEGVAEVRVGPGLELLPRLAAEQRGPFDFVFIDADKPSTAAYFDWAVRLSRPGAAIVVDNVVRDGALVDPGSTDPDVMGMRHFTERLAADPRVSATIVQTVGVKGHDGFALARVVAD